MLEDQKEKSNDIIGLYQETVSLSFIPLDIRENQVERNNQIGFRIINNDQNRENLKYLLDLKNIFARQLPKMPKQYIVKLIFDKNHESMIILKNNSIVVGGVCFRFFKEQKFTEIAFLAITSSEQIKGFGTRLMNKLKQEMQRRKVDFLMTYADNLALGYFKKQGFTKDCQIPQERWKGYIKDYQGGTMMECCIHPTIDYSKINQIIKYQKQFLIEKIKQLSINNYKYHGNLIENKLNDPLIRKNSFGEDQYFKIDPMEIPGIKQSGWTWDDHEQLLKTKEISFLLQCQNIVDLLKKHQSSWPFRQPVSLKNVPDYYKVVKNPIDLKTIQKKLSNNQYQDRQHFCQDIMNIFKNCRIYNHPETIYYQNSNELQDFIKPYLEILKAGKANLSNFEKRGEKLKKKGG